MDIFRAIMAIRLDKKGLAQMTPTEISRVEDYLRKTFNNNQLVINPPAKANAPVEVHVSGEFIGTVYRDEDEGEIAYSLQIMILEEDLPPA